MAFGRPRAWLDTDASLPSVGLPTVAFIVTVLFWEYVVPSLGIPSYILPPPSSIFGAFLTAYPTLFRELAVTLEEFLLGFGASLVGGYSLSLLMFFWTPIEWTIYPYVIVYRSIPVVTLLPICIIWFGFGFGSIVVISFLLSFFPMVVNTLSGFKSTDEEMVELLESFSANRRELYANVYGYSSLPMVFAGVKVSIILAFTGAIVGEFLIGQHGIGHMALYYNNNFETSKMFAAIFTVSLTQLSIYGAVVAVERTVVNWS